jgi:hypothetical protein
MIAAWPLMSEISFGCRRSPRAMISGPTAMLAAAIKVW